MKELGELKHFLGLEVERTKKWLFLDQQKYAKDLLQRYEMIDYKPMFTPMDPNVKLQEDEGKPYLCIGSWSEALSILP